MEIALSIALILISVLGLILIFFRLPGTVLILISAALFSWPLNFTISDAKVLIILSVLTLLGEGMENLIVYFGSKKAKVPNDVILVAIVGGILGTIIGIPIAIIGSLLGLFLGIFLSTLVYSWIKNKNLQIAFQMAKAVLLSQILAIFLKAAIGVIMIVYLLFHLPLFH